MADPILELKDIRKVYGDIVAVDNVTLSLSRGEFVTLLGPSGSGKTTTLQMVAGLQAPSSGHIRLNGEPLDPLPPYRRNIGVVFQHYALFPHMTVARNIAFPLEMRQVPADEMRRRVQETLRLVGLPGYGDRYPRQLSGGQQQRVALARALVFQPPLLLMDEPLGALDKKLREQMQLEISQLHREIETSIIYVTHDQEEALVMSDRIAVFNEGRIEQIGAPSALYDRPRTPFVAGFLGESNFFAGKVTRVNGKDCAIAAAQTELKAFNTASLSIGDDALVAVRPERLRIVASDEVLHDGNLIEGTVSNVVYLGQARKYRVRVADGLDVTTLQQAHEIDIGTLGLGDHVRLTWLAANANALHPGRGAS